MASTKKKRLNPTVYRQKYQDHVRTVDNAKMIQGLMGNIRELKHDAKQQLQLEFESQQTFEYLSEHIKTLRSALISVSDVLVEEVDSTRKEMLEYKLKMQSDMEKVNKTVSFLKSENELLRNELQTYKEMSDVRLEEFKHDIVSSKKKVNKFEKEVQQSLGMLSEQQEMVFDIRKDLSNAPNRHDMKLFKKNLDTLTKDTNRADKALAHDLSSLCADKHRMAKSIEDIRKQIAQLANAVQQDAQRQNSNQHSTQQKTNHDLSQMQLTIDRLEAAQRKSELDRQQDMDVATKKYRSLSSALNVVLDMISKDAQTALKSPLSNARQGFASPLKNHSSMQSPSSSSGNPSSPFNASSFLSSGVPRS